MSDMPELRQRAEASRRSHRGQDAIDSYTEALQAGGNAAGELDDPLRAIDPLQADPGGGSGGCAGPL